MLESLYYSSAGNVQIYFSRGLIALSISLKDIVSIELFDNIENYNQLSNLISLNLTKISTFYHKKDIRIVYLLLLHFCYQKIKKIHQYENWSNILIKNGMLMSRQSYSDYYYTMMKKNVILEVKIGRLKMKFQNQQPVILSLFLSFAKKSMQIKKQNPPKTYVGQSLEIDHLFRIQYEDIDLSKHKYCLLFVYQIKQFGRKKTLGNVPLSIAQFNQKGIQTVKLQQCEDCQASIEITVNVCNGQDLAQVQKVEQSSKNSKSYILKQSNQTNTDIANISQNISNISDKSGKMSKPQMNSNSTRTFRFEQNKDLMKSQSGEIIVVTPQIQPQKDQHLNNKKTAQFFRHQDVSFSDSNNFLSLPFNIQKIRKDYKDLAINLNSSIQSLPHEDKDDQKNIFSHGNISLQMISKPFEEIVTKKSNPIMFNSFAKTQSVEYQHAKKSNKSIQSFDVVQFIPIKKREKAPLKVFRVISISFKGKPSTYIQPQQSVHSVPSKKASTRTQYNYVQSELQMDHAIQPIENLKESNHYINNIMIMRNKYFDAVKINQQIIQENKKLGQNIRLQQTQMNKTSEIFVRTINDLRQKVASSYSLREEYEDIIYEKQHRMRELQWKNESLIQQNRQLRSRVSKLQNNPSHLRQVRSSYGEGKIQSQSDDNRISFNKLPSLSQQQKKIEISSPNLRLKTEYLNNNSSAEDEAVKVNYSKIESTVRAGRIVSNKSSNKTPICSSPQQSRSNSNYSQNGTIVNKKFNNYSDMGQNSRLKSNLYDTPVGSQKKGILIDYMQVKNSAKMSNSQVRNVSDKNGGNLEKQKQTQKRQYFFNKKYLNKEKSQNQKKKS